ncbi:hypothetical protein [Spirosoma oryzae]|nr:hypothetical protein [Spirosoma oryzae]
MRTALLGERWSVRSPIRVSSEGVDCVVSALQGLHNVLAEL